MIAELQEQWLKDKYEVKPQHTNRASNAGSPCSRYLVYSRTSYQMREAPSTHLLSIFEAGHDCEKIVFKWLNDRLDLPIIQPKNKDSFWPALQLSGHLDALLEEEINGKKVWSPVEIKSCSISTFDSVHNFEEMKNSNKHWVRKYCGQMLLYLLLENKERGYFCFYNKESGLLRDFPVVLCDHMDMAEVILKRLEEVNRHVAAGTIPDRFYEPGPPSELCASCDFATLCLPGSSYGEALKLLTEPSVEALLREESELKQALKLVANEERRLKVIGDQLKAFFEGKAKVMIGNYIVTGSVVNKKAQEPTSYWLRKVKLIGTGE